MTTPRRIGGLFQTELTDRQQENSRLNLQEAEAGAVELASYPRRLVLELTNMCNYRCVMCGRNAKSFRPTYLELDFLEALEPLFAHVEEVTLFGWGEPTIHPEFLFLMDFLSRFPHLRIYLLTNGSTLGVLRRYVDNGALDILAVSLDGADAETNDAIRCGSDFGYITGKLKDIADLRHQGVDVPFINLVFVIMHSTVHQLPDMVRLTHDLGLPELKAVYLTSFDGLLEDEVFWHDPEAYRAPRDEALALAEELGVLVKFPPVIGEDALGEAAHKTCHVAWRDLFIGSDKTIRPCQSSALSLGGITKADLATPEAFFALWNSPSMQAFRATVNDAEGMDPGCARCYQSSHANWNMRHAHIQGDSETIPEWEA